MHTRSFANGKSTNRISQLSPSMEEATHFMVKRATDLVSRLVACKGREEPPFSAKHLAALQGIKQVVCADIGESDGMLVRLADGYVITVNASHHEFRQNFSCAHEIGHTFLDELCRQVSLRQIDWRGGTGITEKDKERLCNIAAAELLMPAPIFSKYLLDFGLCIDSIERLARIFRVSIPAAAIRLQEINVEGCRIIRWKRWQRTKSKGFIQDWTRQPAGRTYVRDPSALLKVYESDDTVKSFKCFEIDNISKRCLMESKGFGRDKTRYVLSLVFPDR